MTTNEDEAKDDEKACRTDNLTATCASGALKTSSKTNNRLYAKKTSTDNIQC